jgi:hypothetical protein
MQARTLIVAVTATAMVLAAPALAITCTAPVATAGLVVIAARLFVTTVAPGLLLAAAGRRLPVPLAAGLPIVIVIAVPRPVRVARRRVVVTVPTPRRAVRAATRPPVGAFAARPLVVTRPARSRTVPVGTRRPPLGAVAARARVTPPARRRAIPTTTRPVRVAIGAAPPLVALPTRRWATAVTRRPLAIAVAAAPLPVAPAAPGVGRLAGQTAEAHHDADQHHNEPALPTGAAHIHTPSVAATARSRPPRPPDTPGPSPRRDDTTVGPSLPSPRGDAKGASQEIFRITRAMPNRPLAAAGAATGKRLVKDMGSHADTPGKRTDRTFSSSWRHRWLRTNSSPPAKWRSCSG